VADGMFVGQQTSADTVYLFKEFRPGSSNGTTEVFSMELDQWISVESNILKPVIRSGRIHRYEAIPSAMVLFPYEVKDKSARLYSPEEIKRNYPLAGSYLQTNKKLLENREKGKFKDEQWYRYGRTQNLGLWEQPKLMVPYMVTELAAYLDRSDRFYFITVTTGGYGITTGRPDVTLPYLCGLLNSRLLDFYFKQVSTNFQGGYLAANKQYIEQLPIRVIDCADPADRERRDRMVALVEEMLALHLRLAAARTEHDQKNLKRQIDATDRRIDRLVYDLYNLTEAEIRILERD